MISRHFSAVIQTEKGLFQISEIPHWDGEKFSARGVRWIESKNGWSFDEQILTFRGFREVAAAV